MMEDALVETMNMLIVENVYSNSTSNASVRFALGYAVDAVGCPCIGIRSDQKPTLVGISAKSLLIKLALDDRQKLHVDPTFKLIQSGYQVMILGFQTEL